MTDKKILRILFNNAVEDIKDYKNISYTTIAKLSDIIKDKADNIRNDRSTPEIDDIQRLVTAFPYVKFHFEEAKEIEFAEEKEDYVHRESLTLLKQKVDRCAEEKITCKATEAALKKEIEKLKKIITIQNVLLDTHGIVRKEEE